VAPSPNELTTVEGLGGPVKISNPAPSASKVPQWRELVVTPTPPPSTIVISERPSTKESPPDFQLSVAKASTPSSLVLPEMGKRYKALKTMPDAVIEISPEAQSYAAEFARRIGGTVDSSGRRSKERPSGAALILDYGPSSTIPASTLRGIRAHKLVSPFSSPGLVDISVDVDFTALAEAAVNASQGVEVHGPVEQGQWLERMGIREREKMLIEKLGQDVDGVKRISQAVERLVERGGGGMGKLYKVMAIVPEGGGQRRPVGFGGGLPG
jgi:NADH dehydrogenase [ubiquinone] 1 alpha subcomplex assembly factor 7